MGWISDDWSGDGGYYVDDGPAVTSSSGVSGAWSYGTNMLGQLLGTYGQVETARINASARANTPIYFRDQYGNLVQEGQYTRGQVAAQPSPLLLILLLGGVALAMSKS